MRAWIPTLAAAALLVLLSAAPARSAGAGECEPPAPTFGLCELSFSFEEEDGSAATQAGSHPFAATNTLAVNATEVGGVKTPVDAIKDLRIQLPPGFVADPTATPRCSGAEFVEINTQSRPACADSTAIGIAHVEVGEEQPVQQSPPLYNLEPAPGEVAKFGFVALKVPVTIDIGVNESLPYNGFAEVKGIPQAVRFYGSAVTVWGDPASSIHDDERGHCAGAENGCSVSIPDRPLLTLPTSCTGPLPVGFEAQSWQDPVVPFPIDETVFTAQGLAGCSKLGFNPQISSQPTTSSTESASGLNFHLDVVDENLTTSGGIAHSDIRKAVVTLPKGMTLNPSQAEGLGACSEADFGRETASSGPGQGCPEASKVGSVEVETPLLEGQLLKGSLFVATPYENPYHSLIALYMTIKDPALGLGFRLAGKVEPDPTTGQIVTTFGESGNELPELPFSHFRFHFSEGARGPLVTPPGCGTYATTAVFTPWANPAGSYETTSTFKVTSGVGGGPCPPGGTPPFSPGFEAGSLNNAAHRYSPFDMRLIRQDGEQDMTRFSAVLPPGVVGKIAGLTKCPQADVAVAKARTGPTGGREELASPSCPASSKIGHVLSGVGVGSQLTYVPGSLYLGGAYHGDPLSVIAIVPGVAGPFDVGDVVVQVALTLNPVTGEVEVDGAASDPIPHILKGIPLKVREIRVFADKPEFTLNPTSCEEEATRATLWGGGADPFSSADDQPFGLASRFQAGGCASLGFQPKLGIKLRGGTRRGKFPALKAVVTPRPEDADFSKAVVTLPHSAFLEQGHFGTICTRVQFAAGAGNGASCPPASVYGRARAWTPLLAEPAEGPVYLRSSNHNLPDLVVALKGPPEAPFAVDLAARIDSHMGGIRSSFEAIPDIPVSRFILEMQGGTKGLIVNSTDICRGKHRATANLTGQNGRFDQITPVVQATNCGSSSRHEKKHGRFSHHKRSAASLRRR